MADRLTLDASVLVEYWKQQAPREVVEELLELQRQGTVELAVTARVREDVPAESLASRLSELPDRRARRLEAGARIVARLARPRSSACAPTAASRRLPHLGPRPARAWGAVRRALHYRSHVASGLPLVPRELETLRAAATGMSVDETGRLLNYSPGVVKDWRRSLLDKLGARNVTQAVNIAHERGLLGSSAALPGASAPVASVLVR